MQILISNDDGHEAEGLQALYQSLHSFVDCVVVAPDGNRSASSHALTVRDPLRAVTLDNGFIAVDGTPVDCVHLVSNGLLDTLPDMVVSGINSGMNMGDDVLYSGTVAAAIEGRFLERPSIAFSMSSYQPRHYATGAEIAQQLIKKMLDNPLPKTSILNVNIPDIPIEEIRGLRATRLGSRHKSGELVRSTSRDGETVYWLGPPGEVDDDQPGTDFHAVAEGYVSVTPLHIDMTHHPSIEPLKHWIDD
ncbi:MAG: 5'/3'-nucleotidase SurE [Pseudomonadota bacterium]